MSTPAKPSISQAAAIMGRKGGKAWQSVRNDRITPERRLEIALNAGLIAGEVHTAKARAMAEKAGEPYMPSKPRKRGKNVILSNNGKKIEIL